MVSREQLEAWFQTEAKPTASQFAELFASFLHLSEDKIPIALVEGLSAALSAKATEEFVKNYVSQNGAAEPKFPANTITTDAFGKLAAGSNISGKTPSEVILLAAISYQAPSFSSFAINGEGNTTVPLGYKILREVAAGVGRTFTWATSNSGNVATNSITIRNQTAGVDLMSAMVNDGSEVIALTADILLNADGATVTFRVTGTNSQGANFSRDFTITSRPYIYWGIAPADSVIDEAFIRGLANKSLASGHLANVSGNIGAGQRLFYAYPKSFGNRLFNTPLGAEGASLAKNGGVAVRTTEQEAAQLVGLEYSVTRNEQSGLGNTTYTLVAV